MKVLATSFDSEQRKKRLEYLNNKKENLDKESHQTSAMVRTITQCFSECFCHQILINKSEVFVREYEI